MDTATVQKQTREKMRAAVEHTLHQMSAIHAGKSAPAMVDNINVEVYGNIMKMRELASISTPNAQLIRIQPWDKNNLKAIEKAVQVANVGLTAAILGEAVHCPVPELSRERRDELVKVVHDMAEEGRVNVRNVRREIIDGLKKIQKMHSEDDVKAWEKEVQRLTDEWINVINLNLEKKEKELRQI
jgi:ribosome recycling factor